MGTALEDDIHTYPCASKEAGCSPILMASQFSGILTILNSTAFKQYFLQMLRTLYDTSVSYLFQLTFLGDSNHHWKLHQIPVKVCSTSRTNTRQGSHTHSAHSTLLFHLEPNFWYLTHTSTLRVFTLSACFLKCHPCALPISHWSLTCLPSFLRQIFHFSKGCLFSTNKTFILVCLITPALLSPFYFLFLAQRYMNHLCL